ncbi:MAG: helix-turn-helix domain-containing protein [Bdellovibrionaceae bacterium]|jgi:hypothetical protein|nr:helix-turn-helix domain-containing protein [Pseudobdellovibrionaceae bacterium]
MKRSLMSFDCKEPEKYSKKHKTFFDNRIWMNSKEAAEYLRISVNCLRIRVLRKQIKAHKLCSRLMFLKSDLDECIRPIE